MREKMSRDGRLHPASPTTDNMAMVACQGALLTSGMLYVLHCVVVQAWTDYVRVAQATVRT